MTISAIDAFELRFQAPAPQGNAFGYTDARSCLIVRVETDTGLVGWGETWRFPDIARLFVERHIAGKLLGADPLDRERLFHELYYSAVGYDRQGAFLAALSSVDIALWDLCGKLTRQPISKLLGGTFRDRVEAYASGPFLPPPGGDPVAHFVQEAKGYVESGFRILKMRAGFTPETDLELVRAVREAVGPSVRLAVDFNQSYDRLTAARALKRLAPFDIAWAEEPVAPDDLDGYVYLRQLTDIPVSGGESEATAFRFRELLERRALEIVQPDVSIAGGLTECIKIRHLAESWRVSFMPHVWGSAIGVAATLQLLASMPAYAPTLNPVGPLLEWDRSPNPFREELAADPFAFEGPFMRVPPGNGLGIEINEDVLHKYRVR